MLSVPSPDNSSIDDHSSREGSACEGLGSEEVRGRCEGDFEAHQLLNGRLVNSEVRIPNSLGHLNSSSSKREASEIVAGSSFSLKGETSSTVGSDRGSASASTNSSNSKRDSEENCPTREVNGSQIDSKNMSSKDFEEVKTVDLFGSSIVALTINGRERLCLAQISNTLLKEFSYNEIHNRRVALGITCIQCTPIQLEMLRRAGAMPSSSRRCGMITRREAERLCRSFLVEEQPPELPENFYFTVAHRVNYGCKGRFVPARYISSRAKCIECFYCGEYYSPNKFIFHSHRQPHATDCNPPDSPNINSWRKHIDLDWTQDHSQEVRYAWEDVKSLFNGGTRRRAPNPSSAGGNIVSAQVNLPNGGKNVSRNGHQREKTQLEEDQLIDVEFDDSTNKSVKSSFDWPPSNSTTSSGSRLLGLNSTHRPSSDTLTSLQTPAKRPLSNVSTSAKRVMSQQRSLQRNQPVNEHHINRFMSSADTSSTASFLDSMNLSKPHVSVLANTQRGIRPIAQPLLVEDPVGQDPRPLNSTPSNPMGASMDLTTTNKPLGFSHPIPGSAPNFIYNQLYSQLVQPHRSNQQMSTTFDAQMAFRHHLWSSLLANLQCNNLETYNIQQPQQPSLNQQCSSATVNTDPSVTTAPSLGGHQWGPVTGREQ